MNELIDREAAEIGDLYRSARMSAVESVKYLTAAGEKLKAKKKAVGHGGWLLWLEANYDVLGFGERTAEKLVKAYDLMKSDVNVEYDEIKAISLNRLIWGNAGEDQHEVYEPTALAGEYDVVVIDPPWPMTKIERDVAPNQTGFEYPTMSEEEIAELPIAQVMAADCHVFLWATQKFLPMAQRLFEKWGVKYILEMVWHKPGGFQPFGLPQYNCEFVLYGRRGAPEFVETKDFMCCFNSPRREHSRKPDEFYDTIRRVTAGKRIDIFARGPREGYETWGNQTNRFGEAAE